MTRPGPFQEQRVMGPSPRTEEDNDIREENEEALSLPLSGRRGQGRCFLRSRQRARPPNSRLLPQVRPFLPPHCPDLGVLPPGHVSSSFPQRSLGSPCSIRDAPPPTGDDRLVGRENFLNVLQSLPRLFAVHQAAKFELQ